MRESFLTGPVVNVPGSADPALWLYKYFYHLISPVVPYAGPFGIALLVHPEWRAYFIVPEPGVFEPRMPVQREFRIENRTAGSHNSRSGSRRIRTSATLTTAT